MGYGINVYRKAMSMLEERQRQAEQASFSRVEAFHALCPRAQEITEELSRSAAKIAIAVLESGDTKAALSSLKEKNLLLQAELNELISAKGMTEMELKPQYTCTHCQDTGFVDGRMCRCLKDLQKNIAYKQLSLDVPLERSTFRTFSLSYYSAENQKQMKRIFDFCVRYADTFQKNSPSLLFKGATGLGKTHLSLAIAGAVIDRGFGVIYGSAQNFAVALEKERFDRIEEDELDSTNAQLLFCDLLIMDDLGTEFSSSYVNAALYNIINTRLLSSRPTIINTNLSLKELSVRYSDRFASRIVGQYGVFDFYGSDIRILKRKKQ